MSTTEAPIGGAEGLYRFVHRANAKPDGSLNSGVFSLRRDPAVSVGIESLIRTERFERFCALKPEQGVARITVDAAVSFGLTVAPEDDTSWGEFACCHAVLAGYSGWPNKRKDEVARALRDIANGNIVRAVPVATSD